VEPSSHLAYQQRPHPEILPECWQQFGGDLKEQKFTYAKFFRPRRAGRASRTDCKRVTGISVFVSYQSGHTARLVHRIINR
jgi:hypothetical protein